MSQTAQVPRAVMACGLIVMLGVLVLARIGGGEAELSPAAQPPAPSALLTETATPDIEPAVARTVPELTTRQLRGIRFADVTGTAGLAQAARRLGGQDTFPGQTAGLALTHWPNESSNGRALLSTTQYDSVHFWTLSKGRFVDRTAAVGLAGAGRGTAAGFADLDADGDVDLVLGRQQESVLSVWRNDEGVFTEATRKFGINPRSTAPTAAQTSPYVRGIAFADANLDGKLDFVVTDWNPSPLLVTGETGDIDSGVHPDVKVCLAQQEARKSARLHISQTRLYLASGEGRFTDATQEWGLDPDPVAAFTPQFVELNGDGWPDLLIAGDFCSSRILLNDQGRGFTDATERTRDDQTPFGMGAVLTDLNGDEEPDWIVTGISYQTSSGRCPAMPYTVAGCTGNRVFLGAGDGTFTDATEQVGLRHSGWGWGIVVEDFANTGERQVAIANGASGGGAFYEHFQTDPISFFVGHGGRYVDAAPLVGLEDTALGHALLPIDYDGDGRLDLLVNNSDTGLRLWRNETPQRGRHWVRIALRDLTSPGNLNAWGARVRVTSARGAVTNCWITSSTSYETSWPGECHVGLAGDDGLVQVQVWWPGASLPTSYDELLPDRTVTIRR